MQKRRNYRAHDDSDSDSGSSSSSESLPPPPKKGLVMSCAMLFNLANKDGLCSYILLEVSVQ